MTITFTLEAHDVKAFHSYYIKHDAGVKRARYFQLLLSLILSVYLLRHVINEVPFYILLFGIIEYFILFAIFFLLLTFVVRKYFLWRSLTKDKLAGVLGEHTITLTNEAIIEISKTSESKKLWSGIYKVIYTKNYIYVFTTYAAAYIIPRRAFSDEASMLAFYEYALTNYNSSKKAA